jgi:hypothetical protein
LYKARPGLELTEKFKILYMPGRELAVDEAMIGFKGRFILKQYHPGGAGNFLFSKSSRPALRSTQPPIQWVPGALSPRVKRPGCEVDHSPPTTAEVKKMWIYTSAPMLPYACMA